MLNNGNGSFTPQVGSPLATGGTKPVQMTMSDFNGDGKLDLAVTNNGSDNVGVLLGNGDGTFKAPTHVATGAGPRGLTASALISQIFPDLDHPFRRDADRPPASP